MLLHLLAMHAHFTTTIGVKGEPITVEDLDEACIRTTGRSLFEAPASTYGAPWSAPHGEGPETAPISCELDFGGMEPLPVRIRARAGSRNTPVSLPEGS